MSLFPTTHWSLLAKATLDGNTEGQKALEELCRHYWTPVYQFVLLRGIPVSEAEDLTQDFMVHLVEKSTFGRADRLRGRFRSFLLGALVRFLGDAADRRNALKRGGAAQHLYLDDPDASIDPEEISVPSEIANFFDRQWALTILESALEKVREEYTASKGEPEFVILKNFLPGGQEGTSYEEAARQLSLSVPAFKSEIHRLRRRFRSLVRDEVAQTVSAPHEIEAEMTHLQHVLMDRGTQARGKMKPGATDS